MLSTTYVAASSGIPHHHLRFAAAAARFRCCQTHVFSKSRLGLQQGILMGLFGNLKAQI